MPFGGLLTAGIVSGAGSLFGGLFGSSAAKKAAQQQVDAQNKALAFQQQVYGDQKANQAPYLQAGQTSLGQLMFGLQNGTFGAGSNPNFQAPTAEQASQTPGYQFALQQGQNGVLRGAAAAGGAISGGTLRAEDAFSQGLASTTYQNTFNNALQGYQANLAKQGQEFGQVFAPAQLGEQAAGAINNTGTQMSQNIGNLMTGIGNSQAAGTVGSANAISGGISGLFNGVSQGIGLGALGGAGKGPSPGYNPDYLDVQLPGIPG